MERLYILVGNTTGLAMDIEEEFDKERRRMVADQIERRGLQSPRLLDAMLRVPRHLFIPQEHRDQSYLDGPLAIGCGQTISQPYIVALMTSLLALEGHENVLEVGTGSGYQAAVLAHMAATVHTVERIDTLAIRAREVLDSLGLPNVHVHLGDGTIGWPENAPYQGILVTAAAPAPPQPLLDQLAPDGRLVIPVGGQGHQRLEVWQRSGVGFSSEDLIPVAFVPLRGEHGWKEEEWSGYHPSR